MSEPENPTFEPSPEFQHFLEWQLRRELRRAERFGARGDTPMAMNPARSTLARRAGIAALTLLTLAAGAAGGVAAVRLAGGDDGDRELLLARARLELELAERKHALVRDGLAESEALFAAGFLGQGELLAERAAIEARAAAVRRLAANLEEIELSGAEPRDELWAPLVGGRDFVSERLQTGMEFLERELEVIRLRLQWSEQLFEQGMLHESGLFADRSVLAHASREVQLLLDRLELRVRFLAGELTAAEVDVEERLTGARARLLGLDEDLTRSSAEHERLQARFENGDASSRGLSESKLRLVELKGQRELAGVELELLERERMRVRALAGRPPADDAGGSER